MLLVKILTVYLCTVFSFNRLCNNPTKFFLQLLFYFLTHRFLWHLVKLIFFWKSKQKKQTDSSLLLMTIFFFKCSWWTALSFFHSFTFPFSIRSATRKVLCAFMCVADVNCYRGQNGKGILGTWFQPKLTSAKQ